MLRAAVNLTYLKRGREMRRGSVIEKTSPTGDVARAEDRRERVMVGLGLFWHKLGYLFNVIMLILFLK